MTDSPLLASLLAAVEAAPQDVPLRVHVATLLAEAGRTGEALRHCGQALALARDDRAALALMRRLAAAPSTGRFDFDWGQAEDEVADIPAPAPVVEAPDGRVEDVYRAERPTVRLADVGGMEQVKQRLELALLGPMRNRELARQFGKSLGGGLLLHPRR